MTAKCSTWFWTEFCAGGGNAARINGLHQHQVSRGYRVVGAKVLVLRTGPLKFLGVNGQLPLKWL